jgi:RNA polymerase sigma-70 factor (ECF subfamily)
MDRTQQLTTQMLADRHSLFAFIYGFVRNTHDAEDIFQEVWVRFAAALERGEAVEDATKWCRGTARNLILHYWRDRRTDKVVVDQELMDLVEQAFSEQAGRPDDWLARQQALQDCVQELPERSRHLLRLKYEQGLSAESAARLLAQSVESVWAALSRLRKALRECASRKLRLEGLQP